MYEEMQQRWHDLLTTWEVEPVRAGESFAEICKSYASAGRFYHTLEHIRSVLNTLESLSCHARNMNSLRLAAWLHDVIYDSRKPDNEERSALNLQFNSARTQLFPMHTWSPP